MIATETTSAIPTPAQGRGRGHESFDKIVEVLQGAMDDHAGLLIVREILIEIESIEETEGGCGQCRCEWIDVDIRGRVRELDDSFRFDGSLHGGCECHPIDNDRLRVMYLLRLDIDFDGIECRFHRYVSPDNLERASAPVNRYDPTVFNRILDKLREADTYKHIISFPDGSDVTIDHLGVCEDGEWRTIWFSGFKLYSSFFRCFYFGQIAFSTRDLPFDPAAPSFLFVKGWTEGNSREVSFESYISSDAEIILQTRTIRPADYDDDLPDLVLGT